MEYERLKRLHDELLHLERTSALLAASDRCSSDAENAFLLIERDIQRIRMELFDVIGDGCEKNDESERRKTCIVHHVEQN